MKPEPANRNSNPHWLRTAVIYEVYISSFLDSNGDGFGDLRGVVEKLDYLSSTLGVNTIWLTPFYKSAMMDMGYDIVDFKEVDKIFGNMESFDELISEAHLHGLKVVVDFVPNHTSDQHPWFIKSRSSRNNPKHNWYVWADAKSNGEPPNNWLSVFGGSAWEWDQTTEQYYLHSHLVEQPDLNWRNPEVKNAMLDAAKFWLERGADGLRIDSAERLMKDPEFKNNPPNPKYSSDWNIFNSQLHINDTRHQDIHKLFRELRGFLDSFQPKGSKIAIGETHAADICLWKTYYGENSDELNFPCNFALMRSKWSAQEIKEVVCLLEDSLRDEDVPNYTLGNHDSSRIASKYGFEQARIAAMLLLTLRGVPTLYYGDEIGMTDVDIPPGQKKDGLEKQSKGNGRDSCRTPMQWDSSNNAGFSRGKNPSLWLPLSKNHLKNNVEPQLRDSGSMLNLYRELLRYRKSSLLLQFGSFKVVDVTQDCFGYLRIWKNQKVLVLLNFSHQKREASLSEFGEGEKIISTYMDGVGIINLTDLILRPDEGVIIEIL